MMKSQPCAIKLKLFRLLGCIGFLCLLKLGVLALVFMEKPNLGFDASQNIEHINQVDQNLTTLNNNENKQVKTTEINQSNESAKTDTTSTDKNDPHYMPQGSEAAKLASAIKPKNKQNNKNIETNNENANINNDLEFQAVTPKAPEKDTILDILNLTKLPIVWLGSIQTAYAAATDMPIPQAPAAQQSPFAPAEQNAPVHSPTDIPNIPAAPLPKTSNPSQPTSRDIPGLPAFKPKEAGSSIPAPTSSPVPQIQSATSPEDPNEKAQEIARQQQDILMLRQQMDQRLKDLENAERKVKDMIREAKSLEDSKVKNLVQMYANMKPKTAAKALENMDERIAVRILSGMAPKQSGEILTYTNPAKTAKFTELLTRMRLPE